jgi:23S rRNA-/tRNA-specific pseudouridylate synthase
LDLFDQVDNANNAIITDLKNQFSKTDEYGLLNRLDNDTAGLLYFARTPEIKKQRKQLQKE